MDMSTLTGLLGGAGQAASVILPYTMSEDAISSVKQMGTELGARAPLIGAEAASAAEFTPFAVTTGTAQTAVGPEGGYTQTLSPIGQQIQEGMFNQALGAIPQTQVTPEQLYAQLQEMRAPTTDRQRLALENRLYAQGRGGTSSMMYGGATPEQLALEQSLREQESKDMLTALTQAGALTGQNIQNVAGMLGVGYTPETQALAQLTPAAQFSQIAQSGRLGESEAIYKGGIAGLETEAAGITGAAGLESARVQALGDALAAYFGAEAMKEGQTSPYSALLDALGIGGSSGGSTAAQVAAQVDNLTNWDQQGIE